MGAGPMCDSAQSQNDLELTVVRRLEEGVHVSQAPEERVDGGANR